MLRRSVMFGPTAVVCLMTGFCLALVAQLPANDVSAHPATVAGRVVAEDGTPIVDARVEILYYGGPAVSTTRADGRFSVDIPGGQLRGAMVVAAARGDRLMGHQTLPWDIEGSQAQAVEVTLKPPKQVAIRVTDNEGQPIAGASTGILADFKKFTPRLTDDAGRATHMLPPDVVLHSIYAHKQGTGIDYRALFDPRSVRQGRPHEEIDLSKPFSLVLSDPIAVDVRLIDARDGTPIVGTNVYPWLVKKAGEVDDLNLSYLSDEIMETTGADGIARFDWLPAWNEHNSITFWPNNSNYVRHRVVYEPADVSGSVMMELHKLVPIRGQVRLPGGEPAARITVNAVGEGYAFDGFRGTAESDDEGRYEIRVAPHLIYLLVVADKQWAAAPQTGFAVLPGEPREGVDFGLQPATRIHGRVTVGPDEQPAAGQLIQSYQSGANLHNIEGLSLPNPDGSRRSVQPSFVRSTMTDDDGRFELFVGPGEYDLRGPRQNKIEKFTITDETEREFHFASPRPERGRLSGLVVAGDPPQPMAGARVEGIYRHPLASSDLNITTDENGTFNVERDLHRTVFYARSPDGSHAGMIEIGPDDEQVAIAIAPVAAATGRLLEQESGRPMADREIVYGVRIPMGDDDALWQTRFGGTTTTATDGRFRLEGLVVGQAYDINVTAEGGDRWSPLHQYRPASADEVDFGDLPLAPPYRPPTLQERIADALTGTGKPAAERFQAVLRDARLGTLRVLVVFADPDSPETDAFFQVRFNDRTVSTALADYRLLALSTNGESAAEVLSLAAELGVTFDDQLHQPQLVVLSSDADRLANISTDDFHTDGQLVAKQLVAFLEHNRLPPLDAEVLLNEALATAKAENKRVFVQETASWCGPCWLLSRFVDDHQEIFEKDYIHVKVDQRWTHAVEVMDGIQPENRGGIPWIAILDAEGKVLADSGGPGGNIGFPSAAEPEGIAHFMSMLRASAIRLTQEELTTLEDDLRTR